MSRDAATVRQRVGRRGRTQRGALLLEVILSLTLFVGMAMMILAILGRALDALEEAREHQAACDLARSAMSRIESGIASPESLNGPARLFDEPLNASGDDLPQESDWELVVETEPSAFGGLTLVTVTARRIDTASEGMATMSADDAGRSSYTLRQLVRLGGITGAGSSAARWRAGDGL